LRILEGYEPSEEDRETLGPLIRDVIATSDRTDVTVGALRVVERLGGADLFGLVETLLTSPSDEICCAAAEALRYGTESRDVGAKVRAQYLARTATWARTALWVTLLRLGDTSHRADVRALLNASDADNATRGAILQALRDAEAAWALDAVREQLQSASDVGTQIQAAQTLGAAGSLDDARFLEDLVHRGMRKPVAAALDAALAKIRERFAQS
jgi:hypothetical protein